jgi:hypothetical protein
MIKVYLDDRNLSYNFAEQHFSDADLWAREYCASYQGHNVQDVSDFSYQHDFIALYLFKEERDATMFMLRWA